jgi:hypothetical protein
MSLLRRIDDAVRAAVDGREGPQTLAVLRITLSTALLLTVGGVVARGADAFWRTPEHGGYRQDLRIPWLFDLLGVDASAATDPAIAVALLFGALTLVGFGGRASPFLALQSYLALKTLNPHVGGSYEHLLTNGLWLLVLAPATTTWSADCRLTTGRWSSERTVPTWCRRLFILQLAVVYASTGLGKAGTAWTPIGGFDALYWTLHDTNWTRFQLPGVAWLSPLLKASTAVTWLFEAGWTLVPLWLALRLREPRGRLSRAAHRLDPRPWLTAYGVALHVGIWVLMDVATFSWVTLAWYPALWLPGELERARGWLRALPGRLRSPAAG